MNTNDWYLMATHEWNRKATADTDTLGGWRDRYARWAERRDEIDLPSKITVDDLAEWAGHDVMSAAFLPVPLDRPATLQQARALIAGLPGDLAFAAERALARFWCGARFVDDFSDIYTEEILDPEAGPIEVVVVDYHAAVCDHRAEDGDRHFPARDRWSRRIEVEIAGEPWTAVKTWTGESEPATTAENTTLEEPLIDSDLVLAAKAYRVAGKVRDGARDALADAVRQAVASGMPETQAALIAGVTRMTVRKWLGK